MATTSETVGGLHSNEQPVYVRLYRLINGAWEHQDYVYTAVGP